MQPIRLTAACAAVLALGVSGVSSHGAGVNRHVSISMQAQLTSATTTDGSFELRGALTDSGAYHEDFVIAGDRISAVKTFTGTLGTFVLRIHARLVPITDTRLGFAGGRWRLVSGTGAYAGLHGGGAPALTPASFGDLGTGEVHVRHTGRLG
jgi:hypothetical protein